METIILKPKPPYAITKHLSMFALKDDPTPCIYNNNCCRRMFNEIVYESRVKGEPDEPRIIVRVYRGDTALAREVVSFIYNINLDYNELLNCIRGFPKLLKVALRYRGLRPALSPTLFESVVKSIISQNIPQKLALKITSKLVKEYGDRVEFGDKLFYDFPKPSKLAGASIDKLRSLGLSTRKAEYIVELARRVEQGFDIESIKNLEPREAVEKLVKLRGIGPWTAKLSLMAATGNMSMDLLEDKAVSRGLKLLGLSREDIEYISRECRRHVGLIMYLSALSYEDSRRRA